jgi:predicted tellurium resistance membrane protein TerC
MDLFSLDALVSLVTLSVLEIVLGIDNVIFVAILVAKLPAEHREGIRRAGLALALVLRIVMLTTITWIAGLIRPLFTIASFDVSGRDLVLLAGGLFLLAKSTTEIHDKLEGDEGGEPHARPVASLKRAIVQIAVLDLVFSIDSVITAVGMAQHLPVMVAAVVVSMLVMLAAAPHIGAFIERHPTIKLLALAFLMMVGLVLAAEGLHFHVPKGYVYFAMAFSLTVELLNIRSRKRRSHPVRLHRHTPE